MRIWIDRLRQDIAFAGRSLRRDPSYFAVAVATLALGIGATTALFTIVNGVLLRPLQFPEADTLVVVWERSPAGRTNVVQTQNFLDWRAGSRSFEAIAAFQQLPMNLVAAGEAEQVQGLRVTGEFLRVLGVAPLLGRDIRTGEDVFGARRIVVLGHHLWQQRYGGDPSAVGRQLSVNGSLHDIVGVMPPGFSFPGVRAELFVPLQIDPATAPREGRNFSTVARLRPGVTLAAARTDMDTIAAATARERPQMNARWGATVVPLLDQAVGPVREPLTILFGAVVCVLLIACANVANLALMRATVRGHEMSVRRALGATRARLIHQLVVESLAVALAGGIAGLVLARAAVPAIVSLFPESVSLPRTAEIRVDGVVLVFAIGITMGAALLFGIAPGVQAGSRTVASVLQPGRRSIAGTGRRVRAAFVVAQIALSAILVVAAALLVRSLIRLYDIDPGFRPAHVLTTRMILVPARYGDSARRAAFLEQVLTRIRAIPGVSDAASIHFLPLSGMGSGTPYHRADRPTPAPGERPGGGVSVVTPGYFRTMGIPMLAGRDFDLRDGLRAPLVAVVNRTLAEEQFRGEDPIGKRLKVAWGVAGRPLTDDPEFTIVGIVADSVRAALHVKSGACLYLSHYQAPNFFASLVVRTSGDPQAVASAVRQQIRNVDPEQGTLQTATMDQIVSDSVARPRLQALLLSAFAALALLLACVGLYGVIAYSVEQRRREIGVRLAIGAAPSAVLRLVVGEGLKLTIVGLIAGLAGALATGRYLGTLLYEIRSTDPAVFSGVAALLLLSAIGASYVPARRAMHVEPATILRDE